MAAHELRVLVAQVRQVSSVDPRQVERESRGVGRCHERHVGLRLFSVMLCCRRSRRAICYVLKSNSIFLLFYTFFCVFFAQKQKNMHMNLVYFLFPISYFLFPIPIGCFSLVFYVPLCRSPFGSLRGGDGIRNPHQPPSSSTSHECRRRS